MVRSNERKGREDSQMLQNPYKLDWEVKIFVQERLAQAQPNGTHRSVKPSGNPMQTLARHVRSLSAVRSVVRLARLLLERFPADQDTAQRLESLMGVHPAVHSGPSADGSD